MLFFLYKEEKKYWKYNHGFLIKYFNKELNTLNMVPQHFIERSMTFYLQIFFIYSLSIKKVEGNKFNFYFIYIYINLWSTSKSKLEAELNIYTEKKDHINNWFNK